MTPLILGMILWITPHFLKRLAPDARAAMGAKAKGPIALILLISVLLMIVGYRAAEVIPIYAPLKGMGHLNNLLMLVSIFLLGAGAGKGSLVDKIRHPMLWGAVVWGGAHLLVNGDLASIILFGGIALWGLAQMLLINKAEGPWQRPAPGSLKGDAKNLVITLVIYLIAILIHLWLGHSPFLGSY